MKQGMSLMELASELERQKAAKKDFLADSRSIFVTNGGKVLQAGGDAYPTTETCRRQLAERLGIPVKYFDRMGAEAPALLDENANHWLKADGDRRRMVRTLDGSARAVLSDRYQRIDNADVATIVLPALVDAGAEVVSTQITESRLYIKAVTHRIQREVVVGDVVEAGVMISNSEIGMGAVVVEPFALRLRCKNGMKTPDGRYSRHHVGTRADIGDATYVMLADETIRADDRAILLKARDVVKGALSELALDAYVDKAREAAGSPRIVRPSKAVEVLGKTRGLNELEQEGILAHLIQGGDLSRWGMANAITALAREVESYDRATDLETMGGQVMVATDWKLLAEAGA